MIKQLDIQLHENAQRLLALQIPSYLIEAKLIDFDGIPPLHDTVETLMACGETFFVYERDGRLAGSIACEREGDVLVISRMMVHPDFLRQGIARKLLRHLQAVSDFTTGLRVSTGSRNTPALQLYRSEGFRETGEREVAPGVFITFLEKGSCT
ncbi:GNAT family N-acetyltransferase [Tumebacillus sp. ITR2]|uniref:GNAT family N-acetyltransferase n=1 Tax=Tumebacillus amylolyticus TaxID=2801339 RepID=A0ABS1JBV3_9BACL|nr:GNAT family N-acetyltransferase [Tumebacillus amylolyticus]MBL0387103.1 GNAT family N-acetyltransferase [Tumebacillus amylolyticus]